MAIMALPGPRNLARVVEAPPNTDNRVAAAQAAEVRPRSRVAELQAAFDSALADKRYGDADRLQTELHEARLVLVEAEATTRGIREGIAAAEQERAAEQEALAKAQRQDEARRIIEEALGTEKRELDAIEEALAETRAALDAARAAFGRAQAAQSRVGQARQRFTAARITLGELPPDMPAPATPNKATVLIDSDPLVRELMRWNGQWRR